MCNVVPYWRVPPNNNTISIILPKCHRGEHNASLGKKYLQFRAVCKRFWLLRTLKLFPSDELIQEPDVGENDGSLCNDPSSSFAQRDTAT
mmetsp:Transcript_11543/g.13282  ORF Transcript_11543/g.13282 Transcript_11543/m.13282 type:complete len:90 (-) Transcript_11543:486-755(-)